MPQKRTDAVRRRQPRNKKTLSAVISAVLVLAAVLVYYFPEIETYLTGAPNTDSSARTAHSKHRRRRLRRLLFRCRAGG